MIAVIIDPDGRRVLFSEDRWLHVKRRHPDMTRRLPQILAAVRMPDRRMQGRKPGEEWFLARIDGRLPWLHAVVHYAGGEGWIVTAFRRSEPPKR